MYTGVKRFGVGLYGGLTAIAKNTVESAQSDGLKVSFSDQDPKFN
jgi:hypothetical protein